jgi:hypothetical protein
MMRNTYKILIGIPKRRYRHRWRIILKLILKKTIHEKCILDSSGSDYEIP